MIVSIDQSYTSTGVCVFDCDGKLITTMVLKSEKQEREHDTIHRAVDISDQIVEVVKKYKAKRVALEGLSFGGNVGNTTRDLAGLQYLIVSKMFLLDIPVRIVAPTMVKKFATGKGNAKKEELFDSVPLKDKDQIEQYKKTKGRYDVTDAYWIGKLLVSEMETFE